MRLLVEFELEEDGRLVADVTDLPGVMAYSKTRGEALAAVKALCAAGPRDPDRTR